MDDICRHISISKKTLYQYFEDKDAIVLNFTQTLLDKQHADMVKLSEESENAVKELFAISDYMKDNVCNINPSLLFDLKKYHAEAWEVFTSFKANFMVVHIMNALERGKNEGYFRKDIDVKITSIIRLEMALMPFNPDIFSSDRFNLAEVHLQVFQLFVHGILTLKGHKLYNSYLAIEEED